MTAKDQIVKHLSDGVARTVNQVANNLSMPVAATRRNINQLRAQGRVYLDAILTPNEGRNYYSVVAQ